ncbi:very short patch repair endonuclease [Devosia equisanguinis]|uniref:very short patch repair endonuclease n=1 Tax=Devosia equisanguinis TaxID=2490941 RepID=UPI001CB77A8F|nr:DNA mismatch endonuclease Vsr [Devosia equisanguinis]
MDKIDAVRRSKNMSAIRAKDMKPELAVRRWLHIRGYRYRIHRKDLPGKPDIVFPSRKIAIFVHGCFWHQHHAVGCSDGRRPKSRLEYWDAKLSGNVARDQRNIALLEAKGWKVVVVWECETKAIHDLGSRLINLLK